MSNFLHSLPWTLALGLAAQAAEGDAVPFELSNGIVLTESIASEADPVSTSEAAEPTVAETEASGESSAEDAA